MQHQFSNRNVIFWLQHSNLLKSAMVFQRYSHCAGLCKPILKVSVFNSYIKLTLFIKCYWPNTVKNTQRHEDLLRMTTSTAKPCLGWKRTNALNSLNTTLRLKVCNSGQSKFPMCSKILPEKKKWLHFQKVPVPVFIIPLLLFERLRQTEQKSDSLKWRKHHAWHHIHPVS